MKKKVKIVMLPTNEATGLFKLKDNSIHHSLIKRLRENNEGFNLYFLSYEEIKEEKLRWIMDFRKGMNSLIHQVSVILDSKLCPEIIATTDEYLKEQGVARPSNEFLKKYCELGGIDEVRVEYECLQSSGLSTVDFYTKEEIYRAKTECLEYKLKVAPDNTITCYPLKKERYRRDEVVSLLRKYDKSTRPKMTKLIEDEYDKILDNWIKENL